VTPLSRKFLLKEGTDMKYGARHLKRAIEKHVVFPLASLLATEQIRFGDMLVIDWDKEDQCIEFHREGQGAVIPAPPRRRVRTAAVRTAASASGADKTKESEPELEPVMTR
jgi:ClpA/ClpB-like protein